MRNRDYMRYRQAAKTCSSSILTPRSFPFGGISSGTKLVPWEKFLTAGQKAKIARNPSHRQKAYAELRKRLEAKVVKK